MNTNDILEMFKNKYCKYEDYKTELDIVTGLIISVDFTDLCMTKKEKISKKLSNNENSYNIFYEVNLKLFQHVRDIDTYIKIGILDDDIRIPITKIYLLEKCWTNEDINVLFDKIDKIKQYIFEFNININKFNQGIYEELDPCISKKFKKYNSINKGNIVDFLNIKDKNKYFKQYLIYRNNIIDIIVKDIQRFLNKNIKYKREIKQCLI